MVFFFAGGGDRVRVVTRRARAARRGNARVLLRAVDCAAVAASAAAGGVLVGQQKGARTLANDPRFAQLVEDAVNVCHIVVSAAAPIASRTCFSLPRPYL